MVKLRENTHTHDRARDVPSPCTVPFTLSFVCVLSRKCTVFEAHYLSYTTEVQTTGISTRVAWHTKIKNEQTVSICSSTITQIFFGVLLYNCPTQHHAFILQSYFLHMYKRAHKYAGLVCATANYAIIWIVLLKGSRGSHRNFWISNQLALGSFPTGKFAHQYAVTVKHVICRCALYMWWKKSVRVMV